MAAFCEVFIGWTKLTQKRREFRRNEHVSRKDFATIEYLLRRGRKTLETYSQPGIKDIQL
jgi:hypothetical protein